MSEVRKLARELREFQETDQINLLTTGIRPGREGNGNKQEVETSLVKEFEDKVSFKFNESNSRELNELELKEAAEVKELEEEGAAEGEVKVGEVVENEDGRGEVPLPIDILYEIFLFAGESTFEALACTCTAFYGILHSSSSKFHALLFPYMFPQIAYAIPSSISSHFNIIRKRPRVLTHGVYVNRFTYWRHPGPRNMWTPKDHKPFVEISHYRYFLFTGRGNVIYASTPLEPEEILPLMYNLLLDLSANSINLQSFSTTTGVNKRLSLGRYLVRKNKVSIIVDTLNSKYNGNQQSVKYDLEIEKDADRTWTWLKTERFQGILSYRYSGKSSTSTEVIDYQLPKSEYQRRWKFVSLF